ncbi:hypothetical protein ACJIZ3_008240 [Penstemon smallii]|uniref:Exostosin GT47 domain-containing protein n=1 Tax=Penstemon smallii TaxID=265156 RepID=A0ABD3T999_9LAMI
MSVSVSRKKSRTTKRVKPNDFGSFHSFLAKFIIFLLVFIYIWSSTSTIFSGNMVHVCVSSRKLNNQYCLSAGTRPDFPIPIPHINDTSTFVAEEREHGVNVKDTIDFAGNFDNKSLNNTSEVAFREVEKLIQTQRSWVVPKHSNHTTTCEGKGIYVYDLPSKFNKDLLSQCNEMIPWHNFCKYLSNGAMGELIQKLGSRWYNTHQYSLEVIFHSRILKHPCRVYNQNEAKLFYVPYYGGLDILRWHFKDNVSNDVKDSLGLDLIRWLESQSPWYKNLGKDHVFVLGKISWDFRRYDKSSWGTRLLELDEMYNPIKLLIERQPWHVNDIGIPHPTYFHPQTDADIVTWQLKIMKSNRKSLVSFAGAARPDSSESIRSLLIEQCSSGGKFLNCSTGQCHEPDTVIELFLESEFCLQPPGDSPTRKSVFDSLISGCIPVFFDPFTAYYQYPWHLPEDREKYSVFIDKEEVRNKSTNVVERLMKISAKERENMRRYIVYELLPGLVYGDLNSKFEKFQDAFSLTINNLLERVNRLNEL